MSNFQFSIFNFQLLGKAFTLFALGLYIVFALVLVKQVNLMIETIKVGLEGLIKFVSFVHLIFAVAVFLIALSIL